MQVTVGTVQVDGEVVSVAGPGGLVSGHVEAGGNSLGAQGQGDGLDAASEVALGGEDLREPDGFRIGVEGEVAGPGHLVGCPVGQEQDGFHPVGVPVLGDVDGTGLDRRAVHAGLAQNEIAFLGSGFLRLGIGIGGQVVGVPDQGSHKRGPRLGEVQFKVTLSVHLRRLAASRTREIDHGGSRIDALQRIQDRLVAGGQGQEEASGQ